MRLDARWHATWAALGANAPEAAWQQLRAAYAEPHRAYHTLEHILACLDVFDSVRDHATRPDEIEVALWFHDAVYDTRRSDNEAHSADWCDRVLSQQGAEPAVRDRVRAMILATRHAEPPPPGDPALLVDVDLSILGEDEATFDAYEAAVRREYAWVPEPAFLAGRRKVLRMFLDRPHVFETAPIRARFEARAQANLRRSLARLGP